MPSSVGELVTDFDSSAGFVAELVGTSDAAVGRGEGSVSDCDDFGSVESWLVSSGSASDASDADEANESPVTFRFDSTPSSASDILDDGTWGLSYVPESSYLLGQIARTELNADVLRPLLSIACWGLGFWQPVEVLLPRNNLVLTE